MIGHFAPAETTAVRILRVVMKYTLSLLIVLFAVWLLWSGHYTSLMLVLGLVSCLAVVAVARRMGIVDEEGAPVELPLRALFYLPWLTRQIVKSNIDVARCILDPRLPISPRVIEVRASQQKDIGRVIYANSITLTPGTVSIDTDGDRITVHALTEEAAAGLLTGEMDRRVARLERGS